MSDEDTPGEDEDPFGGEETISGSEGGTFGVDEFEDPDDESLTGGGFDPDEEYRVDVPRIDLGIEGLDEMIRGGIPESSMMVVIGGPGTGKSTFAMEFISQGLSNDENVVYVTLEEDTEQVLESADQKGFGFSDAYQDSLALLEYDPIGMANALESIENNLPEMVSEFGASRVVIDSVSLLEMMFDGSKERRNQVFRFLTSLKEVGVTTLLTSEADSELENSSRHGLVEYLTDAVFHMKQVRPNEFQETRMSIEIQKIRNTNHTRNVSPYELTDDGIKVYKDSAIF